MCTHHADASRRCSDNRSITIPNSLLFSKSIHNIRRSLDQAESCECKIKGHVTEEHVQSIRRHLYAFLSAHRRDFYQRCDVAVAEIDVQDATCKIKVKFYHKVGTQTSIYMAHVTDVRG